MRYKLNKRKRSISKARKLRETDIIGILVVGILLLVLWTTCVTNLVNGNFTGYKNYYGQSMGTFLLLIVLVIGTPICVIMTIRTIEDRRVDTYWTRLKQKGNRPVAERLPRGTDIRRHRHAGVRLNPGFERAC